MKTKDMLLVLIQFILLIAFALVPSGTITGMFLQIVSFIFTVSGILISLFALLNLGTNLTPLPSPKQHSSLVTAGLYKYMRHPIYSGILLTLSGIALYTLNVPRFMITTLLYFLFRYKSEYEEQMLIQKFPEYKIYKQSTGRFFPKLT